jgi:hypothetical protein
MKNLKLNKYIIYLLAAGFLFANLLTIYAQGIPKLSADIKEQVPEEDLLEVFCLTTKWKSGEFFASMDALQEVLVPSLQDLRSVGLEFEMPDIAGYKTRGLAKLDTICQAQTWEEAENAVQDFIVFGESVKQDLQGVNSSFGQDLKAKGEELKSKITGQIDASAEGETSKLEAEVEAEANQLAEQLRYQLEQQAQNMNFGSEAEARAFGESGAQRIRAEVENRVGELVEVRKAQFEAKINDKISEIIGMDVERFKEIGESMGHIEETIKEKAEVNLSQYEQYKMQAMAKRKDLIMGVLDKKINQAADLIRGKAALLDEARLNDPTVKTAEEYILELQADKEALAVEIQSAIDNNDESAIDSAIASMQQKWLDIRSKLEADLAKRQSPFEICSLVVPQISQSKPQIEQGLSQLQLAKEEINLKKQECELSSEPICEKVTSIYDQISSAEEKTQNLLFQINQAQTECSGIVQDSALKEDFLELMIGLRNNGSQWQKEVAVLKNQWLAQKSELEKELAKKPDVKTICAMKELAAGQVDLQRKLDDLNARLEMCDKPCVGTAEACILQASTCSLYRVRSDQFDSAMSKGEKVMAKFALINQKCANPSEVSLTEIITLAREAKQLGEEFLNLRKLAID